MCPSAVFASAAGGPFVAAAESFLHEAREGRLAAGVNVYLNVGGAQKILSGADTARFLHDCHEGALKVETIYNRDGSVSTDETTVTTSFSCTGEQAGYSGSAGVLVFKGSSIVSLIAQVDGYAPAFSRKAG